jgi:signal transduction histidine kinase
VVFARSWVPRSLFGRLFAALSLSIGAVLAVIVLLIVQDRREFAAQAGAWDPTRAWNPAPRIVEVSRRLAALAPRPRQLAIRDMQERPLIAPRPYSQSGTTSPSVEQELRDAVAGSLGPGFRVAAERVKPDDGGAIRLGQPSRPGLAGPGAPRRPLYDVTVTLPGGEDVTFRVDPPRVAPALQSRLLRGLLLLTLLLGLALFVITRHLTRPLAELARAAEIMGRSPSAPPLPETGSSEVREATRAFNTLHERLRRYLDSRTKVLAAMSHDLRTPLMRLRLRVAMVEDPKLAEELAGDLDEMERMVRESLGLFAGLNADEPRAPLDVNRLLRTLQQEFAELGRKLMIEGQSRSPIEAHPLALKRCLTNLADNAVKFGGSAVVRIEDDGERVVLSVLDEGPGLPEEALERVFEPFTRLEGSRSRSTGGTGLGLGIARDIAQLHGGTLRLVNRAPGKGLEARLILPRKRPSATILLRERGGATA